MKSKIVPVKNIARLTTASRALLTRVPGAPGMGVVHGHAGYGKSTAVTWLSNQVPSIYVRARALWTPSAMLGAMLKELRIQPGGSNAAQVDRIVEALARSGQCLFVDEVDYLVKHTKMIETLRDLHDLATMPVVLIGEDTLLQKLSHLPRLSGRIAQDVPFQPLDLEDTALLAKQLCDIEVREDLVARIHAKTAGNCRLTTVALGKVEQQGLAKGLRSVGSADIDAKVPLFTAVTPTLVAA